MNKTFKGKLADGEELRIRLSTNDGLTGYKIIKFQLFPVNYNVTDEYNSRVYSVADIFVQHKSQSANACNFYMELEQVKLDINEATIATLKDMRGRE